MKPTKEQRINILERKMELYSKTLQKHKNRISSLKVSKLRLEHIIQRLKCLERDRIERIKELDERVSILERRIDREI